MAAPSSIDAALLDPFLRGVTFLPLRACTRCWQIRRINKYHFKTYRSLDPYAPTRVVMGLVLMTTLIDGRVDLVLYKITVESMICQVAC
jgi:hypothetical protein